MSIQTCTTMHGAIMREKLSDNFWLKRKRKCAPVTWLADEKRSELEGFVGEDVLLLNDLVGLLLLLALWEDDARFATDRGEGANSATVQLHSQKTIDINALKFNSVEHVLWRHASCLVASASTDNLKVHGLVELTEVFRRESQLEHDLAFSRDYPPEEVESKNRLRSCIENCSTHAGKRTWKLFKLSDTYCTVHVCSLRK